MKKSFLIIIFLLIATKCFADEYYLGQWVWNDTNSNDLYWEAPMSSKLTGVIDLRSIPQQAVAGGTPQGYAIFSYSEPVIHTNLIFNFGDKVDSTISASRRNQLKISLGLSDNITSTNFKDLLWELLTTKADPTGQLRWKPLMPDEKRQIKLFLGAKTPIKEITLTPFVSKEWDIVLQTIQEDYRRLIRTEEPVYIAKWLDKLEEDFGTPYHTFIPKDEIQIASLPHQTTITDDFNCADSVDPTCDLSWTEVEGTVSILTNQIVDALQGTSFTIRAESALSSVNQYSQYIFISESGTGTHLLIPIVRVTSSGATPDFYGFRRQLAASDIHRLEKRVANTTTVIAGPTTEASGLPETLKTQINGSTLKGYIGGVEKQSVTDTAITGNLYTGFRGFNTAGANQGTLDDFEAGDLAVAAASTGRRRIIGIN